ncbi:MAG: hydroxyacylglutathione hydrolase [Pseudanabaenaceae cyanobacterium]
MVKHFSVRVSDQLTIYLLPVLQDNYIFVIHEQINNICAVVDPATAEPVLDFIKYLGSNLVGIFNTHHHHDHVGGNSQLVKHFPNLLVYGGEHDQGRIPHQNRFLIDGDSFYFGVIPVQVLFIPAHTKAHIAYFLPETQDLFCGDTLFSAGCGRLFEGTPQQLFHSLQKLAQLPDSTRVWCAHEYTLKNLNFALSVDQHNPHLPARLSQVQALRAQGQPSLPSTISIEKLTNPFLRWQDRQIQERVGHRDPVRVLGKLRGMRDVY